ncbi:APC family permease [Paenibacillus rigui]|uniref:Putrescine importer PuuP n=1 Tax=Paenibacillus rigui TaxID=554312 RepID=A0A229UHH5_9BACL|nr:APC family permease [Paenibacillus rigui]OXM82868.1 Putrescine importer PuuP [Paenibacillus rigui]
MQETTKLRQTLTLFQVVFLGLAWMTPMIYFSVYGIAYETSHGMLTQAYITAFVAIFFTAYSYGVMSKAHPTSGSAYVYAKKAIHPYVGFLVGWALLLDYLFSPIIACLMFGIYIHAQFPAVPPSVCIIALNIILAVVNIKGINFSAHISKIFVLIQIVFIAVFCTVLVIQLWDSSGPMPSVLQTDVPLPVILTGASIICFSFLGFDSVTTMAEETINAKKNIPRAIMIIILVAIALYMGPSVLTQMAFPGMTFTDVDSAGFELVKLVGGTALSSVFITVLIMAIFTQGLSSTTTVSRLLYVMGRESILPKRIFSYVHPKYKTPALNIILVSAVSLLALVISLDMAVKFVNFGALTGFIFVNLSVIAEKYIREKRRSFNGTLMYLVFPLVGAAFIGWLLSLLDSNALTIGMIWVGLGVVYYAYRSHRLRAGADRPEAAPSGLVSMQSRNARPQREAEAALSVNKYP